MGRPGTPFVAPEHVPRLLGWLSGALGAVLLVEAVNQALALGALSLGALPWPYVVSFAISIPFVAGIGYAGWYLADEPFSPERNPRILGWCLAGAVVWLVINALTMLSFGVASFWAVVGWVRGAVAWGGAFGLAVGVVEARAIENTLAAERERLRAQHLQEKRDLLDYLNSLVRHEVLNATTVVQGRARLLREDLPDGQRAHDHVETIVRRSEDIESIVRDVRRLMETIGNEPTVEPIPLADLVEPEARKARDVDPDATVDVDLPAGTYVHGDEILALVFGNLVSNAVEHNDGDEPRVSVSARVTDGTVAVRVSDDGPGIDPEARESLFERPERTGADHGFGLYIVARFCEQYGGAVELTETGPEGTTFTVTLPGGIDETASASLETDVAIGAS